MANKNKSNTNKNRIVDTDIVKDKSSKTKIEHNKGEESLKDKIVFFISDFPRMLRKFLKYLLIVIVLLMFYFGMRLPRFHEGYMEGLSYQDSKFCDKIMEDDSFTIQDFYYIRQYYNNGTTKAEFCSKLIGVFDAQYKEYLEQQEQENQEKENNESQSAEKQDK